MLDALYEEGIIPTYSFPKNVVSTYARTLLRYFSIVARDRSAWKSAVENARICSFVRQCPFMMTLLEIKRDGSHFTARSGSHTSAKRLVVRLLRVIVTLPERFVKSFHPNKSG